MASDKQVAANRLNALRSSGPKTERGKRAAALNAARHGLSAPLIPAEQMQSIEALAKLIAHECGAMAAAQDVALKMLEYERNVAQQRLQLLRLLEQPREALEGEALVRATVQEFPEYELLQECVEAPTLVGGGLSDSEVEYAANAQREMRQWVLRSQAQSAVRQERELRNSLRYLKRSTNQLVKAVRAVATEGKVI